MSRSIRPTRPSERTPRQRIQAALEKAEQLRGSEPVEKRVVIVRAADILAVIQDCEPEDEAG